MFWANSASGNTDGYVSFRVVLAKPQLIQEKYIESGSYVWTVPEGVTRVHVAACGGGAGALTISSYNSNTTMTGTAGNGGSSSFGTFEVKGGIGASGSSVSMSERNINQAEASSPNGRVGDTKTGTNFDIDLYGATGFALGFSALSEGDYGKGGQSHHYYDSDGTTSQVGAAGNSGAFDTAYIDVTPGQQITIVVGAGGTGTNISNDGDTWRYYATDGNSGFVLLEYEKDE